MILLNHETTKDRVACIVSVEEADVIMHNSKKMNRDGLRLAWTTLRIARAREAREEYIPIQLSRRYLAATALQLAQSGTEHPHQAPVLSPHLVEFGRYNATEAAQCRTLSRQIITFLTDEDSRPPQCSDTSITQ